MRDNAITVKQLNCYVKSLIENDVHLNFINVTGEISNFKNHFSSGHWYFTLKDSDASVRCIMFRSSASKVKFIPEDGVSVVLRGRVSLYEKDGQYQFYAEEMHSIGEGDLSLAFRQIKEKLEKEGLFAEDTKRPLPKYPRKIAVLTSDTGAAIKDITNILNNRYPCCKVIICPVTVQGDFAADDMIKTLERVYRLTDIDLIIIGRGGGSAEDLAPFNSENLARKIYESPFPVISAVGHETDFTICDFVSDVRASTPSHAAELATPQISDLSNVVRDLERSILNRVKHKYELSVSKFSSVTNRSSLSDKISIFTKRQLLTDSLTDRILFSIKDKLSLTEHMVNRQITRIDTLSPLKIMSRGFAVASSDNKSIKSAYESSVGDEIDLRFADGKISCKVTKTPERK